MAGTVGPAQLSQPIVVIVTFEKDQLHPSGKKAAGAQVLAYAMVLSHLFLREDSVLLGWPLYSPSLSFLSCEPGSQLYPPLAGLHEMTPGKMLCKVRSSKPRCFWMF